MLGFALWLLGVVIGLAVSFACADALWGQRRRAVSWLALMIGALVLSALLPMALHAQTIPRAATAHRAELVRAARLHWGLNAPVAALAAQVHQESGWNPRAVSRVGAAGLTQFMPATARWWCEANRLSAAECQPFNPVWALRAQAGYMKYLYDRVPAWAAEKGRAQGALQPVDYNKFWAALRGYNGGLGHWSAEARATGLAAPSRQQVDAACGKARRSRVHCAENLGYPRRILGLIQPRYAAWGGVVAPAHGWAAL